MPPNFFKCFWITITFNFEMSKQISPGKMKKKSAWNQQKLSHTLRCSPCSVPSCLSSPTPPYLLTCTHTWKQEQLLSQLPAGWRRQRPLKIDPRVHVMIVWLAWDFSNWKVDSSSLGYGCWGIKQMKHWEWHLHLSSLLKCDNLIFSKPLGKEENSLYF